MGSPLRLLASADDLAHGMGPLRLGLGGRVSTGFTFTGDSSVIWTDDVFELGEIQFCSSNSMQEVYVRYDSKVNATTEEWRCA